MAMTNEPRAASDFRVNHDVPTIVGFHHIRILVTTVEASSEWYAQTLALDVEVLEEDETSVTGAVLGHPSGVVIGLHRAPELARALRGFSLVGLAVDDIDAWAHHLATLGVTHRDLDDAHLGRCLKLTDPDGIGIELHTTTQPSVDAA